MVQALYAIESRLRQRIEKHARTHPAMTREDCESIILTGRRRFSTRVLKKFKARLEEQKTIVVGRSRMHEAITSP